MHQEPTFPPGTVVRLKSGGPPMTVGEEPKLWHPSYQSIIGRVLCSWVDDDSIPNEAWFYPSQLEVYERQ